MTEKNSTNKPITAVRREILESLASGAMLVIDKANIAWLGDRDVSQTRYWLVENKLVQRKDKQMKVDALGNGLTISSKGLDLLKAQPIAKNRGGEISFVDDMNRTQSESKPSNKQLEYAQSLGIIVLPNMTAEEVSDQIDCSIERDEAAQDIFKKIAIANDVPYSSYTGSKNLRNRIFRRFSSPTKEQHLVRWFAIFVMLDRKALTILDEDVWFKPELLKIAEKLESNQAVVKSIHRYADNDLLFFGKQVFSDGVETTGSSRETTAYKAIAELL